MIGRLDPRYKEVTIVGGGMSGLLAAYYFSRGGYAVRLLEASPRLGGLIQTRETPFGIAEAAAHSIPLTPLVKKHFEELGIAFHAARDQSKFVFRNGKPRRFPLTLGEGISAFFRAIRFKGDPSRMTLEEWATARFGPTARDYLLAPMIQGIYGAELSQIDYAAHPRRGWSPGPTGAPDEGMRAWVSALEKSLRSRVQIELEHPATALPDSPNLIVSVPALAAARLIPELQAALGRVQYSSLVTATVFVRGGKDRKGIGVLYPRVEGRRVLGIFHNSSSFPNRAFQGEHRSFTLFFDGTITDSEIHDLARQELEQEPEHVEIFRHERAVPRYDRELIQLWKTARETWCAKPGRILFSNYSGQVSLRGMLESAAALTRTD